MDNSLLQTDDTTAEKALLWAGLVCASWINLTHFEASTAVLSKWAEVFPQILLGLYWWSTNILNFRLDHFWVYPPNVLWLGILVGSQSGFEYNGAFYCCERDITLLGASWIQCSELVFEYWGSSHVSKGPRSSIFQCIYTACLGKSNDQKKEPMVAI